jgi:hypothetical protein
MLRFALVFPLVVVAFCSVAGVAIAADTFVRGHMRLAPTYHRISVLRRMVTDRTIGPPRAT